MNATESVAHAIEKYCLFPPDARLLLGVSGGSDSTALAYILKALKYEFGIVHVNFQLRGAESEADYTFVIALAKKLNVPFFPEAFDTYSLAKENGLSIQEMARQLRYTFFQKTAGDANYDYIVTAHHASDNVETMLYTLLKGASITGLRGIPIKRDNIVRPLLYTTKKEINTYIDNHKIAFRTDSSNTSDKYTRNYLRNQVIPQLLEINPQLEKTWIETSKIGRELEDWIESEMEAPRKSLNEIGRLSISDIQDKSYRSLWMYQLLKPLGFQSTQVHDLWKAWDAEHKTGKYIECQAYRCFIDRNDIVITRKADALKAPIHQEFTITSLSEASVQSKGLITLESGDKVIKNDSYAATLDADKIKFPFVIRKWKEGDQFAPVGMGGRRKKLNAFLRDEKVNTAFKKDVWVLESDSKIAWVIGFRISELFKIDDESSRLLQIRFNKDLLPIIPSTGDPS